MTIDPNKLNLMKAAQLSVVSAVMRQIELLKQQPPMEDLALPSTKPFEFFLKEYRTIHLSLPRQCGSTTVATLLSQQLNGLLVVASKEYKDYKQAFVDYQNVVTFKQFMNILIQRHNVFVFDGINDESLSTIYRFISSSSSDPEPVIIVVH